MAPSANVGRVLWLKKVKTHEINEMVMKKPSGGFELSCMIILLAPLTTQDSRNAIICAWPLNLIQIKTRATINLIT
jgi:hypothetical protein